MLNLIPYQKRGKIMWHGVIHFVSKRGLYVFTAWLCVFLAHLFAAGCTPEPVMGYAAAAHVPVISKAPVPAP